MLKNTGKLLYKMIYEYKHIIKLVCGQKKITFCLNIEKSDCLGNSTNPFISSPSKFNQKKNYNIQSPIPFNITDITHILSNKTKNHDIRDLGKIRLS